MLVDSDYVFFYIHAFHPLLLIAKPKKQLTKRRLLKHTSFCCINNAKYTQSGPYRRAVEVNKIAIIHSKSKSQHFPLKSSSLDPATSWFSALFKGNQQFKMDGTDIG